MISPILRAVTLSALLLVIGCAKAIQPSGPLIGDPVITKAAEGQAGGASEILYASDSYRLPLRSWLPEGEPKAVILGLHGFNDYSNSFDLPATHWAASGTAVYAYDQRGFGATQKIGVWPGTETLVADISDALHALNARYPDAPVYLLGESMGGAAAILSMTSPQPPDIEGLILVAPAVYSEESIPGYQRLGLLIFSSLLPGLTVDGRGLEIRPSNNYEVLRDMWFDPLTLKDARLDTLKGLVDLMTEAAEAIPSVDAPALMVFGAEEQIIPGVAVTDALAPIRAKWQDDPDLRLGHYASGYHMLLRDLDGPIVWDDIEAWVNDPQTTLPSGADRDAWASLFEQ